MKIEVGKSYRTRGGGKANILLYCAFSQRYRVEINAGGYHHQYDVFVNGREYGDGTTSALDLVAPWEEPAQASDYDTPRLPTFRELAVLAAMQGLSEYYLIEKISDERLAEQSINQANALVAALEKAKQ